MIVVGNEDKDFKKLMLTARAVNEVELFSYKIVRAILAETGSSK